MTELDYEGALEYAKQHGREEGREEGRQAGLQEGREEGALQHQLKVLKNMLDRHMDDESIQAVLGIDEDLLFQLKSQL